MVELTALDRLASYTKTTWYDRKEALTRPKRPTSHYINNVLRIISQAILRFTYYVRDGRRGVAVNTGRHRDAARVIPDTKLPCYT